MMFQFLFNFLFGLLKVLPELGFKRFLELEPLLEVQTDRVVAK